MVSEELCLNMYHHIITEGYTMGNSSLAQQVLKVPPDLDKGKF